jgi:hypothetical protein
MADTGRDWRHWTLSTGGAVPTITAAPNAPEVPDTTPLGAVVATYSVVMSDGSPLTGTVRLARPSILTESQNPT